MHQRSLRELPGAGQGLLQSSITCLEARITDQGRRWQWWSFLSGSRALSPDMGPRESWHRPLSGGCCCLTLFWFLGVWEGCLGWLQRLWNTYELPCDHPFTPTLGERTVLLAPFSAVDALSITKHGTPCSADLGTSAALHCQLLGLTLCSMQT